MDCGVVVRERGDGPHAITVPVHQVKAGDRVLVHEAAVRVVPAPRKDPVSVFGFMSSEVSAERPKELSVAAVADGMIDTKKAGREYPVRRRAGDHPHRRRQIPRSADRGRLDRRPVRGQCARDARHRSGAPRHLARDQAGDGRARRHRPQPSPPRHQQRPPRGRHHAGGAGVRLPPASCTPASHGRSLRVVRHDSRRRAVARRHHRQRAGVRTRCGGAFRA